MKEVLTRGWDETSFMKLVVPFSVLFVLSTEQYIITIDKGLELTKVRDFRLDRMPIVRKVNSAEVWEG
jgi:hypothetical protein